MATTGIENRSADSRVMDKGEHKVIMQVSGLEAGEQRVIVGQINNLLRSLPGAKVEVVFHSQGLPLVVARESEVESGVDALIKRGVIFAAL